MNSDVTVGDKTYKAEELISGISVNVDPKTTATVVFSVKVTNINGAITNVALVGDNEEETNTDETDTANLVVNKEVTSKPDNGKKYVLGEEVTYKVNVTNTGNTTLYDIEVEDELEGITLISKTNIIDTLAPTETKSVEYKYVVQEKDLQGTITNVAVATADDGTTDSDKEDVNTEDRHPGLSVEKEVINPLANEKNMY